VGAVAPAGLGGMIYYPPLHAFLITNGNTTADITVGSVDVIDPLHPITVAGVTKYVPAIINSYPIYNCMPTGLNLGPGTDVLVGCADHDGRAFAPSTVIINGSTGAVLTTINNVGFVDETWYNPGDNNYYLAARDMPTGPVLGVINAGTRLWLQNVPRTATPTAWRQIRSTITSSCRCPRVAAIVKPSPPMVAWASMRRSN
jgi:hypothetical protein